MTINRYSIYLFKIAANIIALTQGSLLNYYIYRYDRSNFSYFCSFDVILLIIVSGVWRLARLQIARILARRNQQAYGLFLCWDLNFWLFYSVFLIARIAYISKTIVPRIDDDDGVAFGATTLKLIISLSSIVFIFIALRDLHYTNHECSGEIKNVLFSIPLDLFDSIDILECLFAKNKEFQPTPTIENIVITFACLNFILPYANILYLDLLVHKDKYGMLVKFGPTIQVCHKLFGLFLLNVPYFVMRIVVYITLDHHVSTFAIKNVLCTFLDFLEFVMLIKSLKRSPLLLPRREENGYKPLDQVEEDTISN